MSGSAWSPFDAAQLPARLLPHQSEFNWYIVEGSGTTETGEERRLAVMFSLHRTGARVERLNLGPTFISRERLGAAGGLVPDWLPLLAPFDLELDSRPLLMVVLYDLDAPECPPKRFELPIDSGAFDARTFSASTSDGSVELRQFSPNAARLPNGAPTDFFAQSGFGALLKARLADIDLELWLKPCKPMLTFGPGASPVLRHGTLVTHYAQRSRLAAQGRIVLRTNGATQRIAQFRGDACQDRQWLSVTHPQLKWLWPQLRLDDGRELMGYVIRDSADGRRASANTGREVGRAGWLIEQDGRVRSLKTFDVRAAREIETDRGLVPTLFHVDVAELDLRVTLEHVVPDPFIRMQAFGGLLDAGAWEGPARIVDASTPLRGHCWVEVVNAATARMDTT